MKKSNLTGFIKKYFLNGLTESAKISVEAGTLKTYFSTGDVNTIGSISLKNSELDDATFGVYTTGDLLKLLSAMDDDLNIVYGPKSSENTLSSLLFSDKSSTATYMLADLSVIKTAPVLKKLPNFDIKVDLTKDFISSFKKAFSALPNAENFAFTRSNGVTKVTINYSTLATNRVEFQVQDVEEGPLSDVAVTCFSSKSFSEILSANSDATSGTIEVAASGLARVSFVGENYEAVYYLIKINIS